MTTSDSSQNSALNRTSVATIAARLERLPMTAYQRMLFLIIATAWFFDSIDLGSLTFVLGSIRSEFGLSAAQTGLLSSMSFAGMFLGAAIAGIAADRYGRTLVFQVSMIFWGAGGLACGLASSVTALGAARALLGFGMGMEFPVAQSIVSEIIPARLRGRYLALLEGFWPLGFIAAGLLARAVLPLGGWRWVFIIEAIPAVFVFAVRFLVPESPRWLAVRSRMAAAEAVMQKFETAVSARLRGGVLPEPQPQPYLKRLNLPNLEVRKHNILDDPLDALGPGSFDLVCSRLMLFWLASKQEAAIRRMVECLRPGGWLVDEDGDWGTVAPVDPSHPCYARYHRTWQGGEWWASRGYDPAFGRKLPALFEHCGLENIRHKASAEVVRGGSPWARWWQQTLEGIRAHEQTDGSLTETRQEEYKALTAPLTDPSFWFLNGLLHACWGQRQGRDQHHRPVSREGHGRDSSVVDLCAQ